MSAANNEPPKAPDPPPQPQTFAQVIAAIAARKGNIASKYSELLGHEQGMVDMTVRAIEAQSNKTIASEQAAAIENGFQCAERYGLGTLVQAIHAYVDGSSGDESSKPTQTFAQVIKAIRKRGPQDEKSKYGELQPGDQGVLDMVIKAIEAQNKRGEKTEAVQNGVLHAERYGLGTFIEALHRYVDGRAPQTTAPEGTWDYRAALAVSEGKLRLD